MFKTLLFQSCQMNCVLINSELVGALCATTFNQIHKDSMITADEMTFFYWEIYIEKLLLWFCFFSFSDIVANKSFKRQRQDKSIEFLIKALVCSLYILYRRTLSYYTWLAGQKIWLYIYLYIFCPIIVSSHLLRYIKQNTSIDYSQNIHRYNSFSLFFWHSRLR